VADSPILGSDAILRVTVFSEGTAIAEQFELISVNVQRSINMVPHARLVLRDGDVALREFAVSDTAAFRPGVTIKIDAGYGDVQSTLFEGVLVKHGIRVDGDNRGRLILECRDKAAAMCVGRRNANYVDQTDSDIISKLIGTHGLAADVDATMVTHAMLVQHYSTDWDFMLARAEAAGLLVIVRDGKVSAKPPQLEEPPVLTVGYGIDLHEFEAEMDARSQLAQAKAVSWDQKTQAVVTSTEAAPTALSPQGDLDGAQLAQVLELDVYRLQTGAMLDKESLTQWAQAQQLKSALARIRGQMRFQGSAKALPGMLIEVSGVGTHFSGTVLLSAVEHRIENGNWTTLARFGMSPSWFVERSDVLAPAAGGLLPGARGLDIGVVMQLDQDPNGEHRVQVSVPVLEAQTAGIWARLATLHGSAGFGSFFIPEIGDEVVLGYFNDDPSCPVILGSLYSSKHAPPYALAASNDTKAVVTRCKSRLEFDEANKVITLTTPGNNKLVMSDTGRSIVIHDQNDNKITLDPAGMVLESPKDIRISAKGTLSLEAIGMISVQSQADVKSVGLNVNCEAQVGFGAKGGATAELSAAGQTTVKGALVMIN
jgi:Rhs element Vgr protein